jgi:hypothetical protein
MCLSTRFSFDKECKSEFCRIIISKVKGEGVGEANTWKQYWLVNCGVIPKPDSDSDGVGVEKKNCWSQYRSHEREKFIWINATEWSICISLKKFSISDFLKLSSKIAIKNFSQSFLEIFVVFKTLPELTGVGVGVDKIFFFGVGVDFFDRAVH